MLVGDLAMAPGDHPALPDNATFCYIAEGAANVVYKICTPLGTSPPSVIADRGDHARLQSDDDLASTRRPRPFESKQHSMTTSIQIRVTRTCPLQKYHVTLSALLTELLLFEYISSIVMLLLTVS